MRALGGLLEHGNVPLHALDAFFLGWVCAMLIICYYVQVNLLHDFQV